MDKHHPTASMDSTPDYRALCQELASLIKTYPPTTTAYWAARKTGAWQRACAALAEPEPEGPSDEDRTKAAFAMGQTGAPSSETERLAFESWMRGHSWLVQGVWNGTTYDDRGPSRVSSVDVGAMQTRMMWAAWRDRAALAQPEPEGPTDEELLSVAASAIDPYEKCGIAIGEYEAETESAVEVYGSELIAYARAVLARWGRHALPVPVSERPWEREGWCDAEGKCWFGAPPDGAADAGWILRKPSERLSHQTASLPHHAMPVPKVQP